MRNIITWSTRGRHPWIVIAVWVLVAGGMAAGPRLQSVTSNDASKSLPASVESKRADALQQASFPAAKGTPIIVVYSSAAALTPADKAAIAEGEAWLTERRRAHQQRPRGVLPGRQGRAALREPRRQPRRRGLPRLGGGDRRPLRRLGERHAGAGHRPRRPHHRRLPDLSQRRREAPPRHGAPGADPPAGHLPLAGPAVRPAARRGLRLLRGRRHPGADRHGAWT